MHDRAVVTFHIAQRLAVERVEGNRYKELR